MSLVNFYPDLSSRDDVRLFQVNSKESDHHEVSSGVSVWAQFQCKRERIQPILLYGNPP